MKTRAGCMIVSTAKTEYEGNMMPTAIDYRQQITDELNDVPEEKLADLARIVHVFTEVPEEERFARSWKQAMEEDVVPLDSLWNSMDD